MKKKKRVWNHKIRFAVFTVLLIFLLSIFSDIMALTDNTDVANIDGFYQEPKNSLEVVLIGPSEIYADYFPTLAWQQYGYTSYNFSVGGIPGNLYASVVNEALKRQKPKLVVFNVSGFYWGDGAYTDEMAMRKWIDHMPWSLNKIQTIQKVIPKEEQMDYFCNLGEYHANWMYPVECAKSFAVKGLFKINGYSRTKGVCSRTLCTKGASLNDSAMQYSFSDQAKEYYKELIEQCQKAGLENVLFVAFPHQVPTGNPEVLETMETMAREHGYDFLNMDKDYASIGIVDETDFADGEHLNVYGMEKFTNYLGGYISKNYDVSTEQSSASAKRWEKCAAATDKIIRDCKEDLENGIARGYFELAVYTRARIHY